MAHLHEKIDFTASVYIVKDDKVLLHKHKKLGIWLPPGGHIELDEDPTEAAVREAKEESGLLVELVGNPRLSPSPSDGSQDLIPPVFLNRHHFNEAHEHVDMVYFARVIDGEVASEEKGGLIDWFDEGRLETNEECLKDAVQRYALAAIAHFRGDMQ